MPPSGSSRVPRKRTPRELATVAGIAVAAGLVGVFLIGRPGTGNPESQPADTSASTTVAPPKTTPSTPAPAPQQTQDVEPLIEEVADLTWVGSRFAGRAPDGSRTITFELAAMHEVPVWRNRARPRLAVRCLSRATEVFVENGSAASIESETGDHTVRVQFDDDPEMVQQWSESSSGHELFAPDGIVMARRIALAKTMRFGFTPYKSPPVVAEFHVSGFDKLVGLVASTCGWRVDGSPSQKQRSARR
jgi:hypothetical protein